MTTSSDHNLIVIDAGIGLALCTPHENSATVRAEFARKAADHIRLFAPSMWRFELTSILTKAVHFRQLSEPLARDALELAQELRVELIAPDQALVLQAFDWTLKL